LRPRIDDATGFDEGQGVSQGEMDKPKSGS
jgi:hypothetical protein